MGAMDKPKQTRNTGKPYGLKLNRQTQMENTNPNTVHQPENLNTNKTNYLTITENSKVIKINEASTPKFKSSSRTANSILNLSESIIVPKLANTSKLHKKKYTTKFKPSSEDKNSLLDKYKDYHKLQTEIQKTFTNVTNLNAYIDNQSKLVITTFSKEDDDKVKQTQFPRNAFDGIEFQIDKYAQKYFFAIKGVSQATNLDTTYYRDYLVNEYGITETKRMCDRKTKEPYKTIRAATTDYEKFQKLMQDGKIKICLTMMSVTEWNFRTGPSQCYKCLGFGHNQTNCKNKQHCLRCGESHNKEDCKVKEDEYCCINCKKANRPHNHAAVSRSCPTMMALAVKQPSTSENFTRKYSDFNRPDRTSIKLLESNHVTKIKELETNFAARINELKETNEINVINLGLLMLELFRNITTTSRETNSPTDFLKELATLYLEDDDIGARF